MTALLLLLACSGTSTSDAPTPKVSAPPAEWPIATPPADQRPQHALIILVDTLRADALTQALTPNIDSIAAAGGAVPNSWSSGTWTVPSVISLFTGMAVRQHGWDLPTGRMGRYPQLPDSPTLAQVLKAEGFSTHGLYANSYLAEELGFDRGFDAWIRTSDKAMPKAFAGVVAETWSQPGRHFAYLHLLGPHSPLKPGAESRARWELDAHWISQASYGFEIGAAKRNQEPGVRDAYRRGYHAAIEDTDAIVGELLAALGEHRKDTLIVFTSDHGELLGEHGVVGHGYWVWGELNEVPLLVQGVGALPSQLSGDGVAPLVTRGLGIGHDWPALSGLGGGPPPLVSQREGKLALSSDGVMKGVWHKEAQGFDLGEDPEETKPLPSVEELERLREIWEAAVPAGDVPSDEVQLPKETIEQVKALGYLE